MELVSELRNTIVDQRLCGYILVEYLKVWSTNGEDVADEIWVPLCNTEYHSTAPVVASNNDLVDTDLLTDTSDGICMVLEAEVFEVWG